MMTTLSAALSIAVTVLQPGAQVYRTISKAEIAVFRVEVPAGGVLNATVDQGATDLSVTVVAPDGTRGPTYDSHERGDEFISFPASVGGIHRLEVRISGSTPRSARFAIRIAPSLLRTPRDDDRAEATRLSTEARQFFRKADGQSLREALVRYRSALPLWERGGERAMVLSTLAGIGDALYRLSEYGDAEASYRQALALSRELADRHAEAEILTNQAMAAWRRGDVAAGLAGLSEAIALWQVVRIPSGEAAALSNRGVLLRQAGQYDDARESYATALRIFRSLQDRRGEASIRNNMAIVLDALGKRDEALGHLTYAIAVFRAIGDQRSEGRALVARAAIELERGRRREAKTSVQRGLRLVQLSGDRRAEADATLQLARVLAAEGHAADAEPLYQQALAAYRAVSNRRGESDVLHEIGITLLNTGHLTDALDALDRARQLRHAAGLRAFEAETLLQMAKAERRQADPGRARTAIESALTIAEGLRRGVFEPELRMSFFGDMRRFYEEYLDVLYDLHRADPAGGFAEVAFEVAERSKAPGLAERLREGSAGWRERMDPQLVIRERRLQNEIAFLSWRLSDQADRASAAESAISIQARLDAVLEERDRLEGEIRRADPRFAALINPDPVPLAAIRQQLDAGTVLIEYALGSARSYVWALTPDRLTMTELPGRRTIERRVRRFREFVAPGPTKQAGQAALSREWAATAGTLSRMLLGPVATMIEGRRILLVPDGALHALPFAALPVPGLSIPLVASSDLVSVPSATSQILLQAGRRTREPPSMMLAAIGDPVFDTSDPRLPERAARPSPPASSSRRAYGRLPFSREEVDRVGALFPLPLTLRAVGFSANRALAMGPELARYRYVLFATHALLDEERPDLSGIVLSLVTPSGAPQNGFLRLRDIYGLRLRADLVALTACETAVGRQVEGEGLISLARGFFYAGALRVMASLWKVDDEATSALTYRFYEGLVSGLSPASALRAAQAQMRRQPRFSHPHYWAGFVVQGAW